MTQRDSRYQLLRYQLLRKEAPQADKDALLRHLRMQTEQPSSWTERLAIAWERRAPQLRAPAYGVSFALALSFVIGLGMVLTPSGPMAPQIDDLDFAGGEALVIEQENQPTTLIWLSEYDEEQAEAEAVEDDAIEEDTDEDKEDI